MTGEFWVMPGSPPRKMGGTGFLAGATPEELVRIMHDATFDECPPAAYEPAARLVEMERDGIEAEVIYTTQGSGMFRLSGRTPAACAVQGLQHVALRVLQPRPDPPSLAWP